MTSNEGWNVQRAVGGWVINHSWNDDDGRYQTEVFVFTTNEELSRFFLELTTKGVN